MPDPACVYHAAPLHYLLRIVQDGALYPQSVLAGRGIRPRATAARRDRRLGLADYVHLSLHPHTPLLADKLKKGYPHALLVFDRECVLALPHTAFIPYNTKAWFDKAAYAPVTDAAQKQSLLEAHAQQGRYPSLEVLVKYGLGFEGLQRIAFCAEEEYGGALQTLLRHWPGLSCAPGHLPGVISHHRHVRSPDTRSGV